MNRARMSLHLALISIIYAQSVSAGTYILVDLGVREETHEPYAVVHPLGYDGSGGLLTIRFCVDDPSSEYPELVGPLTWSLAQWNRLEPITDNCQGCVLWEEPIPPASAMDVASVLLHEFGHCGMALDHINLHESEGLPKQFITGTCDVDSDGCCKEGTSFTASVNAEEVGNLSGYRGDAEDTHENHCPYIPLLTPDPEVLDELPSGWELDCIGEICPDPPICCPPCPGDDCPNVPMQIQNITWFRDSDNDPFIIDNTVIDKDTFTRVTSRLPALHNSPASGNRSVGYHLGYGSSTQTVMYSLGEHGTVYSGITADDVNMVRYGMTGADRIAGTSDDYRAVLAYQNTCTDADLKVSLVAQAATAACDSDIALSFPQPGIKFHYTQTPGGSPTLTVTLDKDETWDYGDALFLASFEGGHLLEWSSVYP